MSPPGDHGVPSPGPAEPVRDPRARYQVLDELGRGGVGAVFRGRDLNLGRDVAVKILHDDSAANPDVVARFIEEAQIGGQLQHPGIVPVYELGTNADDRPFFAMKLVKGETLQAILDRRVDPAADRRRFLGVFEQVCHTMGYAHARRVVHRDLKPENVMIGAFGEVQVVDWGFAKVLPEEAPVTAPDDGADAARRATSIIRTVRTAPGSDSKSVAGTMLGTLAYMPPEQALGDVDRLDVSSDVFALGGILCTILTGEPPYRGAGNELVRRVALADLEDAHERLARCGADPAMTSLAVECLSRQPSKRPADGAAVAARVSAYLTSVEERARKAQLEAAEARYRHRVTFVTAFAALLVLLVGGGSWIWLRGREQDRLTAAGERIAAATTSLGEARGQARRAGLDLSAWEIAFDRARALVTLARTEGVQVEACEQLLAAVQGEHDEVTVEVARRARDAAMAERLVDLRFPRADDVRMADWELFEAQRMTVGYAEAFTEYLDGLDPLTAPVDAVVASIRRGDLERELATSLDEWALSRDRLGGRGGREVDAAGTARLRELAVLVDPDEGWMGRLRAVLPSIDRSGDELQQLAAEAGVAALGAARCRLLASALSGAGRHGVAVTVLRRAQELHPDDFDVSFQLGLTFERLTPPDWLASAEAQRVARALAPGRREAMHRQGIALDQAGLPAEAERVYRDLARQEPDNYHWQFHIARSLSELGRFDEARELMTSLSEREPDDVALLNNLGRLLAQAGQGARAAEIAKRVLELDPDNLFATCNLVTSCLAVGQRRTARKHSEHAIAIAPEDPAALLVHGRVLAAHGEFDEALATLQQAVPVCATGPMRGQVLLAIASIHMGRGEVDAGVDALREATLADPDNGQLHSMLGSALALPDSMPEALQHFDRAIARFEANGPRMQSMLAGIRSLRDVYGRLSDAAEPAYDGARQQLAVSRWCAYAEVADRMGATDILRSSGPRMLGKEPDVFRKEPRYALYVARAFARHYAFARASSPPSVREELERAAHTWLRLAVDGWIAPLGGDGEPAAVARRCLDELDGDTAFDALRGDAIERLVPANREPWRTLWDDIRRAL